MSNALKSKRECKGFKTHEWKHTEPAVLHGPVGRETGVSRGDMRTRTWTERGENGHGMGNKERGGC